jgi:hypothetical protein
MCKCGHLLLIYLFYTDKENSRARRRRRRCGAFLFYEYNNGADADEFGLGKCWCCFFYECAFLGFRVFATQNSSHFLNYHRVSYIGEAA